MKKAVTGVILAVILMICALPVSASAADVLKAPIVQYKLINHDEIALQWTEVDGADGYYIYKTDVETGKTVKCKKLVKDTTYDVTELKASTDYIFKVVAVSEKNGQINVGKKSKGTKLTTPDEWYYFRRYEHISSKPIIERWHYNMTGREEFDMSALYDIFPMNEKYNKLYFDRIFQDRGYVYFDVVYIARDESSYNGTSYLCRMKNDGSDLKKITGICSNNTKKYGIVTDENNEYIYDFDNAIAHNLSGEWADYDYVEEQFDNYKTNPADSWIVDYVQSFVSVRYYDGNSAVSDDIRYDKRCYFSGPAFDNKYVYFMSHPLYNITDRTASEVYRCNPDGSDLQRIMWIPKDMSFIYGDPNNGSIDLFYCDGKYLYYCVYGRKASEKDKDNYYTFYRISLDDKTAVPQKLMSVDRFRSAEIINGYLYVSYTGYNRHEFDEEYVYEGETANIFYKETGSVNDEKYYRVKTDGTKFEKQDEPFEWRY